MGIPTLKKSSNIDRLIKEIDRINSGDTKTEDKRFWKLERDKAGNGSAVIRFLPAPPQDGEDALPWVRIFDHAFKGDSGRWYFENSLTTLGKTDPVSEYNSMLWNKSKDDDSPERKQARAQKRRLKYISNILVVNDPKNPDNNGKVFLFSYGKKIFDKIQQKLQPEFEGEESINPFDMSNGVNFKLRTKSVAGYPNYDESKWDVQSAISEDEDELLRIWNEEHSLLELVSPDKFKSYDELKRKLYEVIAPSTGATQKKNVESRKEETDDDIPAWDSATEDDSDELEKFKQLALG